MIWKLIPNIFKIIILLRFASVFRLFGLSPTPRCFGGWGTVVAKRPKPDFLGSSSTSEVCGLEKMVQ